MTGSSFKVRSSYSVRLLIVQATVQTLKQKVLIDCEFAKLHKAPLCIFLQLFYVRDFAHILIMIPTADVCNSKSSTYEISTSLSSGVLYLSDLRHLSSWL